MKWFGLPRFLVGDELNKNAYRKSMDAGMTLSDTFGQAQAEIEKDERHNDWYASRSQTQ